jgi:hypothetical protein
MSDIPPPGAAFNHHYQHPPFNIKSPIIIVNIKHPTSTIKSPIVGVNIQRTILMIENDDWRLDVEF